MATVPEAQFEELLAEMKARGEISRGQPPKNSAGGSRILIPDLDINHHFAARCQRIAAVPETEAT